MRQFLALVLLPVLMAFTTAEMHKFYVSVNQIHYEASKKELQITSRFFLDDLTLALDKENKTLTYVGTERETQQDVTYLQNYLKKHFHVKVNGKAQEVRFVTKEMEDDVLICYLKIKDVSKVQSLEVHHTLFYKVLPDQQHIIHTNINGQKKSLLLTASKPKDVLKY
jgi:hypothetical protein